MTFDEHADRSFGPKHVPLIRAETLRTLIAAATDATNGAAMGLLTVMLDDPTGYGRIVRDAAGRLVPWEPKTL